MSPSHANKKGRRYRYYVSQALNQQRKNEAGSVTRIPAHDIEALVMEQLGQAIRGDDSLKELSVAWSNLEVGKQGELTRLVTKTVSVGKSEVRIAFSKTLIEVIADQRLWDSEDCIELGDEDAEQEEIIEIAVPVVIKKNGSEKVILLPGSETTDDEPSPHASMMTAIVKAHDWFAKLQSQEVTSVHDLSQRLNMNRRYISRLLRLAFLAPDIVESILEGTQPKSLSLYDLIKPIPVDWDAQRKALGFTAL